MRFRFAVIDSDKGQRNTTDLDPRTDLAETEYAAFYYPWIVISDPQTGARKLVPPGGHVLGVYARTDIERGVFKAPANEIVRGALDLEYRHQRPTPGRPQPQGRQRRSGGFPGRGIRVWGARTLTSERTVEVRSASAGCSSSSNGRSTTAPSGSSSSPTTRLWARVTDTIRLFLRTQWRHGALFGRTEEEAFFVTCDETTMTQDDILNGRLICEIGIAPVRPAEFVDLPHLPEHRRSAALGGPSHGTRTIPSAISASGSRSTASRRPASAR